MSFPAEAPSRGDPVLELRPLLSYQISRQKQRQLNELPNGRHELAAAVPDLELNRARAALSAMPEEGLEPPTRGL